MSNLELVRSLTHKLGSYMDDVQLVLSAIEQANESILITDSDLENGPKIIYVNKAFEVMTGYSQLEVIGKTPKILQGPKTNRDVLDRLKATLKAGEPFFGRAINYKKDASEYLLEWHISLVTDILGKKFFVSIQRSLSELPIVTRDELDQLLT